MSKLTLSSIPSGYATAAAHNADNTAIEAAVENTLSRDGTGPNQMNANLDMNGYAILNQRATSGANFYWMGAWVTGGVYAVNNLVYAPEGTNIGNTLICVMAHTAGATLNGDSAKWAVFAQRGASGAGTGDVIGPASAMADSLVRFNGTTGKLIKDGAVIGTDVQAYSAKTASYVANTLTAANKIPYATALNTASELDFKDEDNMVSDSATAVPSQQSVKAYVDTAVAAVTSLTYATAQNTSSGTAITFSSIPSGTKRISILFSSVSTSGVSPLTIQVGDSGGIENTGYTGTLAVGQQSSNWIVSALSSGFALSDATAASASNAYSGQIVLVNIDGNEWTCVGNVSQSTPVVRMHLVSGTKTLSAVLDRLVITTAGGTDTFDGGKINIAYE